MELQKSNAGNPPKGTVLKYLKISELKAGNVYTCRLSGNKIFINDNKILNIMNKPAIEGIYYVDGKYKTIEFFDNMLY